MFSLNAFCESVSAWVHLMEAFPLLLQNRPALKTFVLLRCRGRNLPSKGTKWREGQYHLRSFMAVLSSLLILAGWKWFDRCASAFPFASLPDSTIKKGFFLTSQPAKTSKLHQPTYCWFHQTQQKHMAVGQNRSVSVPFWGSSKTLAGCSVSELWPSHTYICFSCWQVSKKKTTCLLRHFGNDALRVLMPCSQKPILPALFSFHALPPFPGFRFTKWTWHLLR